LSWEQKWTQSAWGHSTHGTHLLFQLFLTVPFDAPLGHLAKSVSVPGFTLNVATRSVMVSVAFFVGPMPLSSSGSASVYFF
jgi:hypothetical protein